jgi:uncharacterized membrane protein YraQ (UPF0718 family)
MKLDASIVILWALVAVLVFVTWRKKGVAGLREGLAGTYSLVKVIAQIIPFALLAATLVAQLVPGELIGSLIGKDSGFSGLIIASLAGGLVPSGPFLSFPLAMSLFASGAGQAQIVAFLTGWSVYAFYRVAVWELPMMGLRFTALRLAASLILPALAGSLAGQLFRLFA